MLTRLLTWGSVALGSTLLFGIVIFGRELPSYVASSAEGVRWAVKESVPVEFELQRARDMLDGMLPEIHAKIRLVAHEEVEVEVLKKQIRVNEQQLANRGSKLKSMRRTFEDSMVSTDASPRRARELERLSVEFRRYKESESLLSSQRELLAVRENSLQAALQTLEQQSSKKALIEQKIETLAARHRLLKAQSAHTPLDLEAGHLARVDKLLTDVERRVRVASRVLEHELNMVPLEEIVVLDEYDLLAEVDRYLHGPDCEVTAEAVQHEGETTADRNTRH